MRVLQLIDSLKPGGAEKMAVNIANALLPHVDGSFLCCTRQEGMLKDEIKQEVGYLFLKKKSRLDLKAIIILKAFIKKNKIDIVHAHSTSFFLAGLLKLSGSSFKLIWHNHYGASANWRKKDYRVLKKLSRYFVGIICVNISLKEWALKNLKCKNVVEIKNFISEPDPSGRTKIQLKGKEDNFKIICVANLRHEKDHLNLLKAFEILDPDFGISLHLIGQNPATEYSISILNKIEKSPLKHSIFYYGTQNDIIALIKQANLGVLSSSSEGLPLALIEYGLAGIPVVCTDVGKCAELISGLGRLVPPKNPKRLAKEIHFYFNNPIKAKNDGKAIQNLMKENFSEKKIISDFISFYLKVNFE